jgi:sporulation integral membrane protein YtvI
VEPNKKLYQRIAIRSAVIVVSIVLILTVGVWLFWLLLPFFVAYFFSWALNPLVSALNRRTKLPRRAISLILVILAFAAAAALLVNLIWQTASEVVSFSNSWQELIASGEAIVTGVRAHFVLPFGKKLVQESIDPLLEAIRTTLTGLFEPLSGDLISLAAAAAKMVPTALVFVIALVMGTYFILSEFDSFHEKLGEAMQGEALRPVLRVLTVLRQVFGGYLMASFALSLLVALIDMVGLLLLRVDYAVILALLMGVLDFLPYVGSGAILVPWGVACIYTGDWVRGLYLLLLYAVVFLARNIVGRRLMGTRFRRNPFLGLVCSFIGWKLWGVVGMILGPVLCMIAVNLFSSGILDHTIADFKLLFADLRARLGGKTGKNAQESAENSEENC